MRKERKATRKDFYMEIKKSPGRFLSILFIVALGVAFFSGIRASEPDMRLSGDAYFDESGLMDIKAISTYGITAQDVRAIENVEGVLCAEGGYSGDFLHNTKDEQQVLHVMSLQGRMNQVHVGEGRLPRKVGECMADDASGYQIGDKIILESGTEDPVTDTLKTDTLEVTGIGSSPCYLSFGRGSTMVGDGNISAFIVVPEDTFDMDVYTEVYVQVQGAKEQVAFTDAYEKQVKTVLKRMEGITDERAKLRRQELADEAYEKLEEAEKELEAGMAEAEAELADAAEQLKEAEAELADVGEQIRKGRAQLEESEKILNTKQEEVNTARREYYIGFEKLENGKEEYEKGRAEFEAAKPAAQAQIESGRRQLAVFRKELDESRAEYQGLVQMIDKMEADPKQPDDSGYEEWASELRKLSTQAQQYKDSLDAQEVQYTQESSKIEAASQALCTTEAQLARTRAGLDLVEKQLANARSQIESGQEQITSGRTELSRRKKELDQGQAELADGESKLADARQDYEEGRKEAQAKLADGRKKIQDGEAEIADIKEPDWYVYDRSVLIEYDGFGENAERLGAIGRVFPVLFFLVAALISLTSMTRMVEEQRTSIGTMKALGYSKLVIASKYMGYAFLAAAGGSVLGVLAGEKILPYIIVYAYGILYKHLPQILVPYQWEYAVMASAAAVLCTIFATFMACYKELGAQPAVLMRPPAPKNGRRVFLEYIGIVWRRLNFSWKSTVRNLMRYKKRFFMTIFGIGGCMALMLVGFGLKDSCYEIAELQYEDIQLYEGSIYLNEDASETECKELTEMLENQKDIKQFMNVNMQKVTLVNGENEHTACECVLSSVEDIPKFVDFHDRRSKEQYKLSDEGAVISEKTARLLEVKQGDVIELKEEGSKNKKIKISNICENYLGHYIYITPAYYEEIHGKKAEYNSILFSVADSCSLGQMERTGQEILKQNAALSVSYIHDIEKQLDDMLKSLNLVIVVLIISAGMLAFVVLYNLNTVNIAERKRELATLKVLGFYDGEVAGYVYRENILLTFIGAVVGIVLGKFLHLFIIQTVEVDSAMFGRVIHIPSFIYSLLLTVLFSMLINGVMYFKLRKIDMVESLKSIE